MTQKSTSSHKRWFLLGIVSVMVMLLVAACGSAPAAQNVAAQVQLSDEISVQQAYELYEEGTFFLDVRTQEEWDAYHIEGATLIPLDQLESRVDEVPRDQDIVVVCRSGNRSQAGRDILRQAGIGQSTSMAGGVNAWFSAGFPTVGSP
jgi:rhodanese-related sulfurtransferase